MANTHSGKDVIYVDIDDEITALIDHVRSSKEKIVALVLPKRASVLQSIVNMKLLKRTADDSKKHLVLITSEAGLMPLAGAVGMYVAKTLQSRPVVPEAPKQLLDDEEDLIEDAEAEPDIDISKPVGELRDGKPVAAAAPLAAVEDNDDIIVDEATEEAAEPTDKQEAVPAKAEKTKKNKKLAIPDFNKFKLRLALVLLGLAALGALLFIALVVMPKSNVLIKTDSMAVAANSDITLDVTADTVNVEKKIVPAEREMIEKTATQTAKATGQRDKGDKATGSVSLTLTTCPAEIVTVPAGTGISTNGLTYITQEKAVLVGSRKANGTCNNDKDATDTVAVKAQTGGEKYNIAAGASFAVPGYSGVSGVGGKMTGGTTVMAQVLTQADIDGAKQQLASQNNDAIKSELTQKLQAKNVKPFDETFNTNEPQITTSANAGDEVAEVTVTQKAQYSMFGAKEDDLKRVIDEIISKDIDHERQDILDYGLSTASFKPQSQDEKKVSISLGTTVVAGSALDLADIKKQIVGKKANAAQELIDAYPGVVEVKVTYSPFWVKAIPKNEKKIYITVEKPPVKNANE